MRFQLDHPRARASDPITSYEAADAAKEMARHHSERILACLNARGPLGKDGIAALTGIDGVAVARRLPELERDELVSTTGKKVMSLTGRKEREWVSAAWLASRPS